MGICSVCRAVKKKTSLLEVSTRIEELIRNHVNTSYCKNIKSHGSSICTFCKRNLFKLDKGENVSTEWTPTVRAPLPSRSSPNSKLCSNSSPSSTSSLPTSYKICASCCGKLGKFSVLNIFC